MKTSRLALLSSISLVVATCAFTSQVYGQNNTGFGASSASAGQNGIGQLERANKLVGKEVFGVGNQKLGKIDNLVVDLTSGRILYAVVSSSKGKVAVAPGVFSNPKGSEGVNAKIDAQKIDNAPQFTSDIDQPQNIAKADFVSKVYNYFGENDWWAGANNPSQGSFNNVHKTSDLTNTKVEDVNNNKIGTIKNVVVNLPDGRVVYAMFSPASSLNLNDNNALYALPPQTLTWNQDQKSLVSNLSREKLASAPHINNNDWAQLANPAFASQVYQYYGKQAYFSGSNNLQPTGR